MACRLNNIKQKLLSMAINPDLEVISLYINNPITVSYY